MAEGPANFFVVVALSVLHCLGFLLCEITSTLSGDICFYWRMASRVCLAAFMFGGAALRMNKKLVKHLLVPIVPPPLPAHACVYVSGIAELVGGIVLLLPRFERMGASIIMLLLISVFPANIYHAVSKQAQKLTRIGPPAVYVRVPIQFLFCGWARWHLLV